MKIVVINQPLRNRGDEAAHKGLFRNLAKDRNIEIEILFTHNQKVSIDEFNIHFPNVKYTIISEPHIGYVRSFRTMIIYGGAISKILKCSHPLIKKICNIYKSADLVMCAPGGMCMGGFQNWEHLFLLWLAKSMKKRIVYYGRSFGPFPTQTKENRIFKERSLQLLKSFDYISVRDSKSMELADQLSIKYVKTTDCAFLDNIHNTNINISKEITSILPKGEYVVFVPNELIWHPSFAGKVPSKRIDKFYLSIIELIQKKFPEHKIVMLPQLFDVENGDYKYFLKLKQISQNNNITVIPDTVNSDIQQFIISKSKFLIGARYHSVVFAINNNIPFIALSYEHKIEGLLKQLNKESQMVDIVYGLDTQYATNSTLENIERKISISCKDNECTYSAKKIALEALNNFCEQFSINKKL